VPESSKKERGDQKLVAPQVIEKRKFAPELPTALLLVAGVAKERSGGSAACRADGRAFKSAARLVADDAAGSSSEQGTGCGAALGVRSGWCRAVRE
jgi:hypothetical protein